MARDIDRLQAKQLYTQDGKTIKEISIVLGVPEKTIYRWKQESDGTDDDWDAIREVLQLTGVSAGKNVIALAVKKLSEMAASGEVDAGKADAIIKIVKVARSLLRDIDKRGNILLGLNEFIEFLRESHPEQLDALQPYIIEFGSWVKRKYP
jgi:transposase-like protein